MKVLIERFIQKENFDESGNTFFYCDIVKSLDGKFIEIRPANENEIALRIPCEVFYGFNLK